MMQPRKTNSFPLAAGARRWGLVFGVAALVAAEPGRAGSPQLSTLANLPLHFEANRGAAGNPESFVARGRGCNFFVAPTEATLTLVNYDAPPAGSRAERGETWRGRTTQTRTLHFEFPGANPRAQVSGDGELPGKVNYLLGNDPAQWRAGLSLFAQVRVHDIYPGVELVYYGNQQRLEYDFVVAPKADPRSISIRVTGADYLRVDAQGDLVFTLGRDEIRQPKPLIYQTVGGVRKSIPGGYQLTGKETVAFQIGNYDRELALVIDPVLSYATYLGGSGEDAAWDIAADAAGNAYIAGETLSTQLPTTAGAYQTNFGGATTLGGDAFVAKISHTGTDLVYLTYLGGRTDDGALAIAIDGEGNAYLTGFTDSTNFPVKFPLPGQSAIHGQAEPYFGLYLVDGFVTKLNTNGSEMVYSTYLGGTNKDEGLSIAVDAQGSAYVAGFTGSRDFPTTANAVQSLLNGATNTTTATDAFVAKLSFGGTNLVYSTYLGGTNTERATGIAVDAAGRAFVTGLTASTDFTASPDFSAFKAVQTNLAGGFDAFVTALDASGTNLVGSTYLGGRSDDYGYQIALDTAANLFVTGSKLSDNFPVLPSGLNPGGVFKSADAAANWSASSDGLAHTMVYSLAIDPLTPTRLYAGTGRGVARSSDGGATWDTDIGVAGVTNGLAPAIAVDLVRALAVDPVTPATVYAGTPGGVFKSTDGGPNWTLSSTGLTSMAVNALAIHPLSPTTLYAGTDLGVFKSTNSAASWTNTGLGSVQVRALAIDPLAPATLYAATANGVFRSTNGTATWTGYSAGLSLSNLSVQALVADPAATLYAGTALGLFKRINGGTNWTAVNTGLINHQVNTLAIDPVTPTTIYAGMRVGLFQSLDGGNSWNAATNGLGVLDVGALAIHPTAPATLYAGTFGVASFGGTDAFLAKLGSSGFSVVFGGLGKDEGWDVAVDKATGNPFVAGVTASANFLAGVMNATNSPTGLFGSLAATNSGASDAFLAVFNSGGTALNFGAYLGGQANDSGYGIDVDPAGNAYMVGETASTNFPTAAALQPAFAGGAGDAFVARIRFEPAQPTLSVAQSGENVVLSWSALAAEFVLQSNTNVVSGDGWVNVAAPPVLAAGKLTVTLGATNDALFFRLRDP